MFIYARSVVGGICDVGVVNIGRSRRERGSGGAEGQGGHVDCEGFGERECIRDSFGGVETEAAVRDRLIGILENSTR